MQTIQTTTLRRQLATARVLGFEWLMSPEGEVVYLDDLAAEFDDLDVVVAVPPVRHRNDVPVGGEVWRGIDPDALADELAVGYLRSMAPDAEFDRVDCSRAVGERIAGGAEVHALVDPELVVSRVRGLLRQRVASLAGIEAAV